MRSVQSFQDFIFYKMSPLKSSWPTEVSGNKVKLNNIEYVLVFIYLIKNFIDANYQHYGFIKFPFDIKQVIELIIFLCIWQIYIGHICLMTLDFYVATNHYVCVQCFSLIEIEKYMVTNLPSSLFENPVRPCLHSLWWLTNCSYLNIKAK